MTEKKGWGSTVAGWFIVQDDKTAGAEDASVATVADASTDYTSSAGEASELSDFTTASTTDDADSSQPAPPALKDGQVDFEAVFESAGVDAEERGRVARAVELLRSLPAGTDAAVKKQIVEASLRAFGVPVEKIIEAGAEEIQALEYYIRAGAADTEKLIGESEQRIREYEEEIKIIRRIMQERVHEQQTVIKVCNDKKLEVQQILEFFGQEKVAAVVKASPKLQDPSASPEESAAN